MKQYNIFGGVDDLNQENERDIDPIKKRMDHIHNCFMTVYILDMNYTFCQFMKDFKEKFNFKI